MFQRHLSDNRSCACGCDREDAAHFLLQCPLFTRVRAATIMISHSHHTVQDLLNGNPTLTVSDNEILFMTVQSFIKQSGRFGQ